MAARWKGALWLVGALVMLLLVTLPALAGEYHYQDNLICSDCHTMHYSLQHDYQGGGAPSLGQGGPFKHLLRYSENDLCLTCHDGADFAPDVVGANSNDYVREAGALTTGTSPYEDWKGHTLGSSNTAPGGTWSPGGNGLRCVDCHKEHGNSYYRNLKYGQVSYATGTNDTNKDVFLRSWVKGQIATNYSVDNVDFNEPNASDSGIGQFCKHCHENFHGSSSDSNMNSNGWIRHPTADANIGGAMLSRFSGHAYRVKVMSPNGDWGTQGQAWSNPPNNLTPTCISCHKAHGNQNAFGLIFLEGTGPLTEEGDSNGQSLGLPALCRQCHTQGTA